MRANLLWLLCCALLSCAAQAAPLQEEDAGKARLVQKLEADLVENQKQIDELRGYIARYGKKPPPDQDRQAMRFAIDPQRALEGALQRQRDQRAFLDLIRQTDARQVPALLTAVLLSCEQGACQHRMNYLTAEDLIATFGTPALQPLLGSFKTLDAPRRESTLNLLLRIKPLQCPTGLLDRALGDAVFRVRAVALSVYRQNCTYAAFEQRLDQLLARETDAESLLYLLDQVPDEGEQSGRVYNRLIRLVQDKRIPADKALGKLCSQTMSAARLDVAVLNIPFWLDVFEAHPPRQGCLVEHLFLKLNQDRHLRQLRGLFRAAAEHRYRFSAVLGLYGTASPALPAYWNAIPGADEKMLTLFREHLSRSTLRAWFADATSGEKLLLTKWLGQDLSRVVPGHLQLHLEVRSPANAVVSSTIQNVRLGQPFQFTLTSKAAGLQEVRYDGTVRLDHENLRYRIKPMVIGLKPAGAGFEAEIPVTGSFETELLLRQEKYRWRIWLTPVSTLEK